MVGPEVAGYFWLVTGVLTDTLIANVIERPAGVIIAGIFILLLVVVSETSRYYRSAEMRVFDVIFKDQELSFQALKVMSE
jgi:hypothetical protein